MKLSDPVVAHIVNLGTLATSLMAAAGESNHNVGDEANALASRLIAMATDLTKEPDPVKASSPLIITEEQLAAAIGVGRIPKSNHPVDVARMLFEEIHGQPSALNAKQP